MFAAARVLLLGATTLAAGRRNLTLPPVPLEGLCGRDPLSTLAEQCRPADAQVRPEHVLLPLLLPCAVQLCVHMPTLLLASRVRARQLRAATAHVAAAWAAVALCAYAYLSHPAVAYALALHSAAFLLAQPSEPGLLIGPCPERTARWGCTAALLAGALYLGPPLPLLDAPGLSRCCGSAAHLAGLLVPDAAVGAAVGVALRVLP